MKLPWAFAAVALLAGCATTTPVQKMYEGPDRSDADVATVVVPRQFTIDDINDKTMDSNFFDASHERILKLLPGDYTFGVSFSSPFEFGPERPGVRTSRQPYTAKLLAGNTYQFTANVKDEHSVDISLAERPRLPARAAAADREPAPAPTIVPATDLQQAWHAASADERAEFLKWIKASQQ